MSEADLARARVIDLPLVDTLNPRPAFLPPSVPADLLDRLLVLHGHPGAWWVGQLIGFLMRLSEEGQETVGAKGREHGAEESPVVGIHVRRSDKVENKNRLRSEI